MAALSPLPLPLSVSRDARGVLLPVPDWKTLAGDGAYRAARASALERDQRVCRGCGYTFGLEVDFLDYDERNLALANLVMLCRWCRWTRHIEWALKNRLALLIMHPAWPERELPAQAELFMLARAMYFAPPAQGLDERATRLAEYLASECGDAFKNWFVGECYPMALYLQQMKPDEYALRYAREGKPGVHGLLDGVRLLPAPPDVLGAQATGVIAGNMKNELQERETERKEYVRQVGMDWQRYAIPTPGSKAPAHV